MFILQFYILFCLEYVWGEGVNTVYVLDKQIRLKYSLVNKEDYADNLLCIDMQIRKCADILVSSFETATAAEEMHEP